MLLHLQAGRFINANNSSVFSRRAEENESVEPDCRSEFCSRAAAMVSAHRCASSACNHTGNRPEEWSDLLNPENPDWMCGTSGRTGLACGLCKDGAALNADKRCESCGDAEDLWVFTVFTGLLSVLGGGAVGYLVVWRPVFQEEHDPFGDHDYRTGLVGSKIQTSTGETGAPGAGGETSDAIAGTKGDEKAENPDEKAENPEMTQKDVMCCIMKAPEQLQKKVDDTQKLLEDVVTFPNQVAEYFMRYNQVAEYFMRYLDGFITDTIGSGDESDPDDRRRALMGFFKIVLSYFQLTASFFKNFAVDWGEILQRYLNMMSILNLDFYNLPGLNCIIMMQIPTRTWQMAFYIGLVPLCLFVLALPRCLCFVFEPWMLTVWERSRSRSGKKEDLLIEYQNSLTGLNEQDSRKLQTAKDYVRKIRERRTAISFHRASWTTRSSVVGWAILLVGGFVVCYNFEVKASNNAVTQLDSLATTMVGKKCKGQLERLDARIASQCDLSGEKDKASCLFCGYGEFRKSANDCLLCPYGSELDVINRDCTGVCRKIDRGGNASVQLPLYKALAERKCFPKQGSECVIAEIMGRYDFVPASNGTERWQLKYDIGCTTRSGTRMGSSRTSNLAGIRRLKNLNLSGVIEGYSDGTSHCPLSQEGCPHFEARQEYKHFDLLKTWNDAERACVEWGGHLASFHSFADMINATASFMGKTSSMQAWIGLSRDAQNRWTWSDGTQSTYAASNWWGFSSSWTTAVQTWCGRTSKSGQVPPQPRPTPGHDCVYVTLHGDASTCQDIQNPENKLESSVLKYSGWTNGACSAAKHFVCSKPLAGCVSARAPTSWPPLDPLQMQGDGGVYWKAMCEIKSGNGFGALSGEGELPYSICDSPWTEYAEAFGHTARRTSASKASETVSITPKQSSIFIIFAYISAVLSLICALALIICTKFGMNGIAVVELISTNILGPIAFAVCVHGALSDTPEPAERLRDRAEWAPGLLVLPAALFLHLSLGFFILPSKKSPCPWIHGAGYLGLEVFYLAIASFGTASALGLVLTDAAGLRLLIGLGTCAGLSILLILYGIASALGKRQRGEAFTILALFLCACGLGVGTYLGQKKPEVVGSLLSLSLLLALLCYCMIIRSCKVAIELEERLSFHNDLETGALNLVNSLSGSQVEQAGHSKPLTRDNLHKALTDNLKNLGLKWLPAGDTKPTKGLNLEHAKLAEALRSKTKFTKQECKFTKQEWEAFCIKDLCTDHFIQSGNTYFQPVSDTRDWIKEAEKIYHLLIDERKISTFHMKEQVTKTWLFSWTLFLFTFYPVLSAVAISGFDCEDYGPEGWRLRDHPGAFCPYKYAFGVVLRYENSGQEVFQNTSQIEAKTSYRTSADNPDHLFGLSVAGLLLFALGIPVYMYLLLVINGVPKIAHRKRSHAAFQAFARYWRAKKVPTEIDYLASYLIPRQKSTSKGRIVISVPEKIMPYIRQVETSEQMSSQNKLMSEVEEIVKTLAGSSEHIDVKLGLKWLTLGLKWLPAGDTKPITGRNLEHAKLAETLRSKTKFTKQEWEAFCIKDLCTDHFIQSGDTYFQPVSDTCRLEIRVTKKNSDITDDLMNQGKLSVHQILDELNQRLKQMKSQVQSQELPDVWDYSTSGDEIFHKIVHHLFKRMAKTDAARQKNHRDAKSRRDKALEGLSHANWTVFDEEMFLIRQIYDAPCKDEFWEKGVVDPENVAKMSVGALKEELSARGIDATGNKAALVARLTEALEKPPLAMADGEEKDAGKRPNALLGSNPYVSAVDIFEFVRKKQLGARRNQKHSLVSKNADEEFEFVKSEMERQYVLKKSFVTLLRDLTDFDTDGGGDHIDTDGGGDHREDRVGTIPSRREQLRKLLQKERMKQPELDHAEFFKMCQDIQMSSTFILPADDLGSLPEYKLNKLYKFVVKELMELKVWFEVKFQTTGYKFFLEDHGLDIVKAMLESTLKGAKEVKKQEKDRILTSLKLDNEGEGEGEGEGEEEEKGEGEGETEGEKEEDENNVAGKAFGARDDTSKIQTVADNQWFGAGWVNAFRRRGQTQDEGDSRQETRTLDVCSLPPPRARAMS